MIIEVGKPVPWELDPKKKGYVRQLTVYCPVRKQHFVISENTALRETLVFTSDDKGNFKTSIEVAGGKGCTLEGVLGGWADGSLYWFNDDIKIDC
jgi:hypothetical protein